jgi:hypothetical protein
MPYTTRGVAGTDVRDGTITLRELAQVQWTITQPITDDVLTGPPTTMTGTMTVDGEARNLTMTITRDSDGVPTEIEVVMTGYDGDPNVTFTYTPDRDANGNLIGQNLIVS